MKQKDIKAEWKLPKKIQVLESRQIKKVLLIGKPYMRWELGKEWIDFRRN